MATTKEVNCQRCGELFVARVADINRGWGKFCSKRCKAIKQAYGRRAVTTKLGREDLKFAKQQR
jgi:endogenous inhibitor of DNA gyrase (YacG/DUF329 family)